MSNAPLPSSFDHDTDFYEENRWQKFSRRLKEEPLIPLGCALTCYALYGATKSMRRGDHHTTNRMFRARIYAQAFTLLAVVAGSMYYKQDREKRKEFEGAVAERKAKEKAEAWIRELEARDQEDKELRAKRDAAREAARRVDREGQARKVVEVGEVKGSGGVVEIGEAKGDGRITGAVKELVQGKK